MYYFQTLELLKKEVHMYLYTLRIQICKEFDTDVENVYVLKFSTFGSVSSKTTAINNGKFIKFSSEIRKINCMKTCIT